MSSKPVIEVFQNPAELSRVAAQRIANLINKTINQKKRAVLGLATGGTPEQTYRELIPLLSSGDLLNGRLVTFNLDEYYPIDGHNSQSYRRYMWDHLFQHLGFDDYEKYLEVVNRGAGPIYIPDGSVKRASLGDYFNWYEQKIHDMGGIDLQILGIGKNGHIAFNEPDSPPDSLTRLVSLTDDTIAANARYFNHSEDVPREAMTMGIRTILGARQIFLLATGDGKADAVARALEGEISVNMPASFLQQNGDRVTFMLDTAAASRLKRRRS